MGYLANFRVYTLAMVGIIVIALLVFKNSTGIGAKNNSKYLKVHDTLSLGPRKTLYIVYSVLSVPVHGIVYRAFVVLFEHIDMYHILAYEYLLAYLDNLILAVLVEQYNVVHV